MTTTKVTDDSFDKDVIKATSPVLVDFWAEWCGPCKVIAPALDDLAKDMAGKVTVVEVEHVVPTGSLDPDSVHLPGIYVHRIVHNPNPSKIIEKRTITERKGA